MYYAQPVQTSLLWINETAPWFIYFFPCLNLIPRPLELGRDMTLLEVWCAPGDSEVEMEENKNPSFQFTKIEKTFSNIGNVALVEIGFKPELVTSRGETFRVERTKEELNL